MMKKLTDHERALEYCERRLSSAKKEVRDAAIAAVMYGLTYERKHGRGEGTAQAIRVCMVSPKPTTAAEICEMTGLQRDEVATHLAMMRTRGHATQIGSTDRWLLSGQGIRLLMGHSTRRHRLAAESRLPIKQTPASKKPAGAKKKRAKKSASKR
jgi:hypothetical protein